MDVDSTRTTEPSLQSSGPPKSGGRPSLATALRRYPVVALTVLAGVSVAVLLLAGQESPAQWVASIFALAVAVYQSVGMVRDILHGRWGIDILAVTAIVATVSVGEYIASLIIVLMLSGGAALEDFAASRATRELTSLLERAPRTAHRLNDAGESTDIPIAAVEVGDVLLVRPAEVVPVDALLLSASAMFDESALTGESLPVEHESGNPISSGALNGPAAIRIQATAREENSQYSRIIALVREASSSRAPVVRLADRYAVPFTIFALVLAGFAWFISGDPARFAQVLVVATPCPLLIAAPVAFLGGMSRAAKAGIIVKGAGTLEQISRVRTAAFDKTGTLTGGQPTLEDIRSVSLAPLELLNLAASAEQYSSHVLAAAIVTEALARGLSLDSTDNATEHATHGVSALFHDHTVLVGKQSFVAEHSADVQPTSLSAGQMAVYVGVDGHFAGTLIMRDPLRPEAAATLAALRTLGVTETVMLTGDADATARFIGDEVGITNIKSGLLPEDKVRLVNSLPQRLVMMVGDGVNDAPVLAAADVGIAMGAKGSTAASESADVVIMHDDLAKVADAVRVGRRTVRIAIESIWIGIALSVVLMFLAAAGNIPAVAGALSQEAVDLAAILNALRALTPGRKKR
ncbi:heavy metal translocating P-type ATPase [Arthrobacter cryoconiti]|uniref:Heavy metal translocating P-type ATPase n=1 Tax=Arthrobacter cryoconiti TaxID=748907 RepID=A0ABV8QZF2_9MICC|nr:heavy metal translocating P-type ATPase [Arthrobacter cryoconiti]MCC9069286.1 heavy metal translocating P-type ATPase [Arthrobacter cryoconiti]